MRSQCTGTERGEGLHDIITIMVVDDRSLSTKRLSCNIGWYTLARETQPPAHRSHDRQRTPSLRESSYPDNKKSKRCGADARFQRNCDPMSDIPPCREISKEKRKWASTNTILCLDYRSRGNLSILYTDPAHYYVPKWFHSMPSSTYLGQ